MAVAWAIMDALLVLWCPGALPTALSADTDSLARVALENVSFRMLKCGSGSLLINDDLSCMIGGRTRASATGFGSVD